MKSKEPITGQPQLSGADPYQALNDFFERYELRECQLELWRLLGAAFSSEDADSWDRFDRGNAVFFCKNMDEVLRSLFEIKDKLINPQSNGQ